MDTEALFRMLGILAWGVGACCLLPALCFFYSVHRFALRFLLHHVLLLLEFVRALVFVRGAGSMPGRARWGCWQASCPCWGSCVAGVFARLLSSEPGRVLRCGAVGDGSLAYGRRL